MLECFFHIFSRRRSCLSATSEFTCQAVRDGYSQMVATAMSNVSGPFGLLANLILRRIATMNVSKEPQHFRAEHMKKLDSLTGETSFMLDFQ